MQSQKTNNIFFAILSFVVQTDENENIFLQVKTMITELKESFGYLSCPWQTYHLSQTLSYMIESPRLNQKSLTIR